MLVLLFQLGVTLCCCGMLAVGLLNLRRVARDRRLARATPLPAELPFISVMVPARNEGRNIRACLETLAAQDYRHPDGSPAYEVILLDDCSEDDTLAIAHELAAAHPQIQVMQGRPLAPGWIGKPHACMQMAERARGQWLLFTDADTEFSPRALGQALRLATARQADLLSGLPSMLIGTLWERLSVPMLGVTGIGLISFDLIAERGWWQNAAASGAFLFFRREVYEALGGHHIVANNIVEDITLARQTKRAGYRLVMTDVSDLVACRMYTTFREVWEGFTKNFNKTFPGHVILGAFAFVLACFVAPWLFYLFGAGWGLPALLSTTLPLVCIASTGALRAAVDRQVGRPDFIGLLLMPLAAIFITIIGMESYRRSLFKLGTPWRGRTYELWKKDEPEN